MVKEPRYANLIVSVVGKCVSNDGTNVMLETGDGTQVRIQHEGALEPGQQTAFVEIVGCVTEDFVQCFVCRPMGDEFDLETYNEMITLQNTKYQNIMMQDDYIVA
ncbi:hypothetical protein TL16_g01880 [Triparma laevis f. inornata]|uniref:Replication factor A protein 3 n=2 Tax=Triparma laevis TaxID=1534972 RepID=A0A9W6ZLN7_9STRA|nr:hypothetical protein TL16_g01880 [Triparma laevis f. inornata]GMH56682.1 hypothetical protein TrLO_g4273 [Triparma laevis f. longispina]